MSSTVELHNEGGTHKGDEMDLPWSWQSTVSRWNDWQPGRVQTGYPGDDELPEQS
jgi:hypothetical protein